MKSLGTILKSVLFFEREKRAKGKQMYAGSGQSWLGFGKAGILAFALLMTGTGLSYAQSETAYAQTEHMFASADICLAHVHEIEDRSLTVSLNADQFNLLIEHLVAATEFCRAEALDDAQQQLADAAQIIIANSPRADNK